MTDRLQSSPATEGALVLTDAVRFARRNWVWVAVLGAVAALLALVSVVLEAPRYRAAALLMVGGEKPNAEFVPPLLPTEGYLRLLDSRGVMAEALRQLESSEEGKGVAAEDLDFEAELSTSRRGELGNSTLIELRSEAGTAPRAAAAANAWAAAFLETEYRQVLQFAMQTALQGLLSEQQKARDKLERSEDRLRQLSARLAETRSTLKVKSRLSDREILHGEAGSGAVLESEALNPLFSDLSTQAATIEAEVGALRSQTSELEATRLSLTQKLAELEAGIAARSAKPELRTLVADLPGVVLPVYGSARLVSAAVEPLRAEPSRGAARVVIAFLGGALLGLLAAAVREALSSTAN